MLYCAYFNSSQKTSFNYILLDPRVTKNLPNRAEQMADVDRLRVFCSAVFYIGKGKRSRPYEHFYDAAKEDKTEKKVEYVIFLTL